MNLTVVIIAILLWVFYKKGSNGLPTWLVKALGVFLVIMLLRNLNEAYHFIFDESDAWWPLVKENAARFNQQLRDLIQTMMKGS
ncbi:hypothetical protein GCM10010912_58660 [Paenibacillus albidus]|uniref:Uncharacterized protein n=1 Tax=Paenibacillus albidus TaxID=2041023 RepID=A0A917D2X2_9BACL|nr:hypothetical protein [Paenibacillus albidus]GGG06338.1 hypothetical protein GCM10010912_58660 [Paenibacillus albidus]